MFTLRKKLAVCAALLFASTIAASAQTSLGEPQLATADETRTAALQSEPLATANRGAVGAANTRALWDDPQIRDFVGLSKNAWDFADPNAVPGFAPIESTEK
jgi:hypothetical protein